jgi:hypothetical protein
VSVGTLIGREDTLGVVMWNTVGPHTPAVYWRRRLVVLASAVIVLVLIVLTVRALFSHGGGPSEAAAPPVTPSPTPTATSSGADGQTTASSPGSVASSSAAKGSASTSRSGSAAAPPAPCAPGQLQVQAVVGQQRYNVGDHPKLILQVTNTGPKACVQDVADSQIELRVYNGASRVWGSHDCQIQPGVDRRTLQVNRPVGFSIEWSGLTAQPGCEGTRQRVGAGTYTLYASLSGHQGKAAVFSIS